MDHTVCPGARFLRQPRPEIFECPDCGEEVEIWSDEIRGTCSACGRHVFRDGLPSCVQWCKYGKDCVGEEAFGTYQRNRALGLKQRLLEVLRRQELLGPQEADIRERAAGWAEAILADEPAAWHLVIPAVLVHDVHFPGGSARDTLEGLLHGQGLDPDDVKAVCGILEELSQSAGAPAGLEARVVRDARALAELSDEGDRPGTKRQNALHLGRLSTPTANRLARGAGTMEESDA